MAGELKRSSDFCARWGGEEFIALLPALDAKDALEAAERVRAKIAALTVPGGDGAGTSITVSIGVHTAIPSADISMGDFIKGADKALYKAKEAGRNRVMASK